MPKGIWVSLYKPEAVLTVFHVSVYRALTPPDKEETDVLTPV